MSGMSREEVESLIQEVLEVYPEKAKKTALNTWRRTTQN